MTKRQSDSSAPAFELEVMRTAFQRWVDEDKVSEDQWRPRVKKLIRIVTDDEYVDPNLVEWIVRK